MTAAFATTLAGLGFAGSFVAGLVGVGGAIVMIPLLYYVPPWLGVGALDMKLVAGVTMGQVLAATAMGTALHGGAGAVHRPLAVVAGTSMAVASLAGALASRYVSSRFLLTVFGVMGLLALVLMFLPLPAESGGSPGGEVAFDRTAAMVYPAAIGVAERAGGGGRRLPPHAGARRRAADSLPDEHRDLARDHGSLGADRLPGEAR